MDREGSEKPIETTEARYTAALQRFQEGGKIEEAFHANFKPIIDQAKEHKLDHVLIPVADCIGDIVTLSPEQQAYVDATEELLVTMGYEVEEEATYQPSDGTLDGNKTYVKLKIILSD